MNILVLGGTRFIGRAIVKKLSAEGHHLTLLHRGEHTANLRHSKVEIIHFDRHDFPKVPSELQNRSFDIVIDSCAMKQGDVSQFLQAFEGNFGRYVLLSSVDVYRAFDTVLHNKTLRDALPLHEEAPLRSTRHIFQNIVKGREDYEKLFCEAEALQHPNISTVILRLPFVYGPFDYRRREWFFIRRIQKELPIVWGGVSSWLGTRVYVEEVVRGIDLIMRHPAADREIFVLGEPQTPTLEQLGRQIAEILDKPVQFFEIPDELLPAHLEDYGRRPQHLLFSSEKIRQVLGYKEKCSPTDTLRKTVEWHIANPPEENEETVKEEEDKEADVLRTWKTLLDANL